MNTNDSIITEKVQEEDSINLKQTFFRYIIHWKWIVASLIVFLALGYLYIKITVPIYDTKSGILIKGKNASPGSSDDLMAQLYLFSGSKETDNEIEIFKSYALMERVVEDLGVNVRYYVKDGLRKKELYKNSPVKIEIVTMSDSLCLKPLILQIAGKDRIEIAGKKYSFDSLVHISSGDIKVQLIDSLLKSPYLKDEITVTISTKKSMTKALQNALSVTTPTKGKATVLYLNIATPNPEMGVDILNRLMENYNKTNIEDKNRLAANTLDFINNRLGALVIELTDAEKDVERFKSENKITDIGAESKLFLERVQSKDAEISKVNIQLGVLQNIERYVLSRNNDATAAPATFGIEDHTLLNLISQLTTLESQRIKEMKTMQPENPIVMALDEQIATLKRSIYSTIQTLKRSLEITRQSLVSDNSRLEYMIRSIPQKERALVDVTRQQSIKNELYVFLLSKREEVMISYNSTISDSRVIDYPVCSDGPVKPINRNIFLIFAIVGLVLPICIIYIKGLTQNKIENKNDIRQATSIPIIGDISFLEHKTEPIIISREAKNIQAEQIRTLRTNIQYMSGNSGAKVLLFTSNTSGEGKSFTSLNLGAGLALAAKKTIILGFDMRRPQLQKDLTLNNNVGLSSYLSGQATLDEITYPVPGIQNYFIMPSGPIPPNPVELMMTERLDVLFEELKANYDYIVMDSPPVGLVSDSLILGKHADITLYLVRQGLTPKESLRHIDDLYQNGRFKNVGIIVNGVKDDSLYYGYKRNDSYYHHDKK